MDTHLRTGPGLHRRPAGGLGAAGAARLRRGARARRAQAAPDCRCGPSAGGRARHGLHRVHRPPRARRRHALVRAAGAREPPACLRQALEAPCGSAPRRPHQRARPHAGRAVAGALRRPDLQRVGVRQGTRAAGGRPRDLRAHGPLRRGGRLDRLAAHRLLRPQRLHGRVQGHLPGRAVPGPRLPGRAERRLRRLRRGEGAAPDRTAGGRRRTAHRTGSRMDGPAGGDPGRRGERRRPRHRPSGAGDRPGADGGDHGDVDVPRHEP